MDFGLFFIVGILGIALVVSSISFLALREKYRPLAKLGIAIVAILFLLFVASAGWLVYVYGLNEPLASAAIEGDLSRVRLLLRLGASPNAVGVDNVNTALTGAAEAGHTEIVKLLLAKGADPFRKDGEGQTPLECAKRNGHADIVRLIEEAQKKNQN